MTTISPPRGPQRSGPADPASRRPTPSVPAPPITPTDALPALLGALSVLGGTLAIPPMISGGGWFLETAEVVLVIWLVGVGARLARIPAAAVVLLQLAAAAIAMTALFTVRGYGGVIPNGAVIQEAADLLTGAWVQIRTTVSPTPSSTELSFLICLSVSATAFVVDLLITVCRAPALVALPLLCLYAVPASIDVTMLPWSAFAAPAVLYAMLLVASGLAGRRAGTAGAAQVVAGLSLACVATVVAILLADTVTGIGTAGRLPRTSDGTSAGIGLSKHTSLAGSLVRGEPVDMLRVTGLPGPAYLRTVGLQRWTGDGFTTNGLAAGDLPDEPLVAGQTQVTVTPLAYQDDFLPVYRGVTAVADVDAGWTFDRALMAVHRDEPISPDPYLVTAVFAQPTADELRADTASSGGELLETGNLRPEVIAAATQATAGATTAFDKADRLRSFLSTANGFAYDDVVPVGTSGDPLLDFLENKRGACQQFASAMAVMLRAVGVPAQVAVGFTQGTRTSAGDYIITSNDAHAWVEVPFDRAGWVEFDPTPVDNGQGGQQGFSDGTSQSTPSQSAGASASPNLGEEQQLGRDEIPTGAASSTRSAAADAAGVDPGPVVPSGVWWALGLVAMLAVALVGPTVVRRRRRDRHLAHADAGGPEAAAAAWREIEDLAIDHGIALDPAQSARACANRLAKAAHLSETGRAQLRVLVSAAERGWYAGGPADAGTGPVVTQERLGDAPRTLAVELAHAAPLSPLERLVPRSVRPGWWRD